MSGRRATVAAERIRPHARVRPLEAREGSLLTSHGMVVTPIAEEGHLAEGVHQEEIYTVLIHDRVVGRGRQFGETLGAYHREGGHQAMNVVELGSVEDPGHAVIQHNQVAVAGLIHHHGLVHRVLVHQGAVRVLILHTQGTREAGVVLVVSLSAQLVDEAGIGEALAEIVGMILGTVGLGRRDQKGHLQMIVSFDGSRTFHLY